MGVPEKNSKVAKKAMQNIDAIVMAIPARSQDLNSTEKNFAQVSMTLQNQAVEQYYKREIF